MKKSEINSLNKKQYNQIADQYSEWIKNKRNDEQKRYVEKLNCYLKQNSKILDLGCGSLTGYASRYLIQHYNNYTGIDLSEEQLKIACMQFPEANFICMDMTEYKYIENSFDVIVSFFSIFHVPISEQVVLFQNIYKSLSSGGVFLGTVSFLDDAFEDVNKWFDVDLYFAGLGKENYKKLFKNIGFNVLNFEVVYDSDYKEEKIGNLWILAQKN